MDDAPSEGFSGIDLPPSSKPVSVYRNLRLQNVDAEGVTYLMIGDASPAAAVALTPEQSVELCELLAQHREALSYVTQAI